MAKKPLFIVVCGDGINCERETAFAVEHAGGAAKTVHVNDLIAAPDVLKTADGLAIPGGFSFGDELGSGQILALKIRHKLGDKFFKLVEAKRPVIGICNGFQVLVKLGLLPYPNASERILALASNEQGGFINRWVTLDVNAKSVCHWTKDLAKQQIELPIRHGEGRIAFKKGDEQKEYNALIAQGLVPLTYSEDVNGSYGRIAALTDPSGMVLGLMPHPEAFMFQQTYRQPGNAIAEKGDGALIFDNMLRILKGEESHGRRTG
ncbi:MAG TPA: phosphoribosylformylglycinamidine synthase subunit PurQ [Patescibacteria group bacterium]|nr:phosphoribosylformylglycinamidine synthase subunit PurQ [Patescibacteria group bacterium]